MTNQPEWELVWSTDYSALYRDKTGVNDPELMIAQTDDDTDEDDIEATVAYVYRFDLPRLEIVRIPDDNDPRIVREYLVPFGFSARADLPHDISQYDEWFHKSLASVATTCDHASIREDLCSDDVNKRAHAYESIGGHHGYDNLDGYPEEWTAHEFAEWPERGEKLDSAERDAFTHGYLTCALWANALAYKHDDGCPCDEKPEDSDACTCEPDLVSAGDSGGPEPTPDDLTDDAREHMTREAHEFYADNVADIRASTLGMEQAGHDFSLTRNRHGAGFWDRKSRGDVADAALDRLTEASHAYGEESYIVGDDGNVSVL
jgi:hypothetical protein